MANTHTETIIDQFTRQAAAFTALPIHSDGEAMELCLSLAKLSQEDKVLDVACGPGILACCMARTAHQVDGLDVTPAMLEQAKLRQKNEGLINVDWHLGNGLNLPFRDSSYSLVTSRYAFHHMPEPGAILAEMRRVCAEEGRIMIIDVTPTEAAQAEYDNLERLRDPSHVRALTEQQLLKIASAHGLTLMSQARYCLNVELEQQIAASAMTHADASEIRQRLTKDADQGVDRYGLSARKEGQDIYVSYPISVFIFSLDALKY